MRKSRPALRRRGNSRSKAQSNSVALAVSAAAGALLSATGAFGRGVQVDHVAAGGAKIVRNGPDLRITASTNRTVIDYAQFDLTRNQSVQFILPSTAARLLNRIESAEPSHIDGRVTSNGIIYFVSPAGVIFGPNAVIDVGALYAAAANLTNTDFAAGANHFTGARGAVVNQGSIKADVVTMVGRQVANNGVVLGKSTVTMIAGDDVLVGDRFGGIMVRAGSVSQSVAAAQAPAPAESPLAAGDLYSLAVINTGRIQSPGITLRAGAGNASVSGSLDASSARHGAKGGTIEVTGKEVTLDHAAINASGNAGGGTVLVGGDAHGQGTTPHASQTTVTAGTTIRADAGQTGDGGKVVVWSDGATQFHGAVSARGGATSGDGGFVETSGHTLDTTGGAVDASAPHGTPGAWLLDPFNVTIDAPPTSPNDTVDSTGLAPIANDAYVDPTTIANSLSNGTSVQIATTNANLPAGSSGTQQGNIVVNGSIQASVPAPQPGHANTSLTLLADGNLTVNPAVTIKSTGSPLDVNLLAPTGNLVVNGSVQAANLKLDGQQVTLNASGSNLALNSLQIQSRQTPGVVTAQSLSVTQDTTLNNVTLTTNAGQIYNGTVFVGPLGASLTDTSPAAGIHFNGKVTMSAGGGAGPYSMTLSTVAGTTFMQPVTIGSLEVMSGLTNVSGGLISTTAGQTYSARIDLGGPTEFDANGPAPDHAGQNVDFLFTTLDAGNFDLTFKIKSPFPVPDNSASRLMNLNNITFGFSGGGSTILSGNLTTPGSQTYNDPVSLSGPTNLMGGGNISFGAGISGSYPLKVTAGGTTEFSNQSLASASVSVLGLTVTGPAKIDSIAVDTGIADQIYQSTLTLGRSLNSGTAGSTLTTLHGANLSSTTIDGGGAYDLTLQFTGGLTIDPAKIVGVHNFAAGPANSMTTFVTPVADTFTTTGSQTYFDPVQLTSNTTLVSSNGATPAVGSRIAFFKAVTGLYLLKTDTTAITEFGNNALVNIGTLLVATGGAQSDGTSITTGSTQTYQGGLSLAAIPPANPSQTVLTASGLTYTGNVAGNGNDLTLKILSPAPYSLDANTLTGLRNFAMGPSGAGATTNLSGTLQTSGTQTFNDPVMLIGATSLISTGSGQAGSITFASTLGGGSGLRASAASTTFRGTVNIGSLNIAAGEARVYGGGVTTAQDQSYVGQVTVSVSDTADPVNFVSNTNGNITFLGPIVAAGYSLQVNTGGVTTFARDVTAATLQTDYAGTVGEGTTIGRAGSPTPTVTITTTGSQTYSDPVTLAGNVKVTSSAAATDGPITFVRDVSGAFDLESKTAGTTKFGGPVNIGTLKVSQGDAAINSGTTASPATVTTFGLQTYAGKTLIGGADGSSVTFSSTNGDAIDFEHELIGSGHPVTVSSSGTATFGGMVTVGSLTVSDPRGTAAVNGNSVTTTLFQSFAGQVSVGGGDTADPVTFLNNGTGDITFLGPIFASGYMLQVNTGGVTTFARNVTAASLKNDVGVTGISTTIGGTASPSPVTITTTGLQTYGDPVTLASDVTVTSTAGTAADGPITFAHDLNGAFALESKTPGTTTFGGPVNIGTLNVSQGDTAINSGTATVTATVTTSGFQNYAGKTMIGGTDGAAAVLSSTTGQSITFVHELMGTTHAVTVSTGGTATFGGPVTLDSLTVSDPRGTAAVNAQSVATGHFQSYAGDVIVGGSSPTVNFTSSWDPTSGSGSGDITFGGALHNPLTGNTPGVLVGTAGHSIFDGVVKLKSLTTTYTPYSGSGDAGTEVNGGSVITGDTQNFGDDVTVGGAAQIVTFQSTNDQGITFNRTLVGTALSPAGYEVDLTTGGTVKFVGTVHVGSLQVTSAAGTAEVDGGLVNSITGQTYAGRVTSAADGANPLTFSSVRNGALTFSGPIEVGDHDLHVDTGGQTTLARNVTAGSLETDDEGGANEGTLIGGGASLVTISTARTQSYHDPVTLAGDVLLTSSGSGDAGAVAFDQRVSGPHNLESRTAGTTTFGGPVNVATLNVSVGDAAIDGERDDLNPPQFAVTTSGLQNYAGNVFIGGAFPNVILESTGGQGITFHQMLTGPSSNLTITTAGQTTFDGVVTLASLSVSEPTGTAQVSGGAVTTSGSQSFAGDVTVTFNSNPNVATDPTRFTSTASGPITFGKVLQNPTSGGPGVVVNTAGATTFDGAVSLKNLTTDFEGASDLGTAINGGSVATDQFQLYGDDVTLGGTINTVSFLSRAKNGATNGQADITFGRTLSSTLEADLSTPATVRFKGVVSLGALKVTDSSGNTEVDTSSVTTVRDQIYSGTVVLNAPPGPPQPVTFTSTASGAITFAKTLTGTGPTATTGSAVTVNTAGQSSFMGAVAVLSLTTDSPPTEFPGTTLIDGGSVRTGTFQNYFDPVKLNMPPGPQAPSTSLIAGDSVTFHQTLTGPTALVIDTPALTTFDGAVDLGSGGAVGSLDVHTGKAEIDGGSVSTALFQEYANDVMLGGVNPVTFTSTRAGAITFAGRLSGTGSDVTVATAGLTTFDGEVTLASLHVSQGKTQVNGGLVETVNDQAYADDVMLGGVNPVRFQSDHAGTIRFSGRLTGTGSDVLLNTQGDGFLSQPVSVRSLTTDAGGATHIDGGSVTTVAQQLYQDDVKLGQDAVLSSTGNAPIGFAQTIGDAHSLTVTTAGLTTFDGAVALTSLTTNGGGITDLNGHTVTTTATQNYQDDVVLTSMTDLSSSGTGPSGSITFARTLSGNFPLQANTAGHTIFGGTVNVFSLRTDSPGVTEINGGTVTTTATQSYGDDVTLGHDATLASGGSGASGNVAFSGTVSGLSYNLVVNTAGTTTFSQPVNVGSLTTDAPGQTQINGGLVNTTRFQQYGDPVTLGAPATQITAGNGSGDFVLFAQTLSGPSQLTVTTAGLTTFGGAVNTASLLTNGGGVTAINGGTITTASTQSYVDDVTLGNNAILTSNASGEIAFSGTVTGPAFDLSINTAGTTTFSKPVNVGSLTTDAPGLTQINGGSVVTTRFQKYGDPITLAAQVTQITAGNASGDFVLFAQTVSGPSQLTVTTASPTSFIGAVDVATLTTNGGGQTIVKGGMITTSGLQRFDDDFVLAAGALLHSTGNGPITFNGTVTGPFELHVTTAGDTTFARAVDIGGSLTTDGSGTTAVNGSSVVTGGAQSFADAVTLGADTRFQSTGNGQISFATTLSGPHQLTVTTGGTAAFGGPVTAASLLTNGGGVTAINGGTVTTTYTQFYSDDVTLGNNTILSSNASGDITFSGKVTGPAYDLTVNTAGGTTFGGGVNVGSLTTDAPGTTQINADSVETTRFQQYNDPVTLGAPTTAINAGDFVHFEQTLRNAQSASAALTIRTPSPITFGGTVELGSLATSGPQDLSGTDTKGGSVFFNTGSITTSRSQSFNNNVFVGQDTTFVSNSAGSITFLGSLQPASGVAPRALVIDTSGTSTFKGEVEASTLTTDDMPVFAAGTTEIDANITTAGSIQFHNNVTTQADAVTINSQGNAVHLYGQLLGKQSGETFNIQTGGNGGTGEVDIDGGIAGVTRNSDGTLIASGTLKLTINASPQTNLDNTPPTLPTAFTGGANVWIRDGAQVASATIQGANVLVLGGLEATTGNILLQPNPHLVDLTTPSSANGQRVLPDVQPAGMVGGIPDDGILVLQGNITADRGSIYLAPAVRTGALPRSVVPLPSVATIMNRLPDAAVQDSHNVSITAANGNIVMGPQEKFTVSGEGGSGVNSGDLTLSAIHGFAQVSDLSAFRNLQVTAGQIMLQPRDPSYLLGTNSRIDGHDHGLDFFGGSQVSFNGQVIIAGSKRRASFASARVGTWDGSVLGQANEFPVFVQPDHFGKPTEFTAALDLTPIGPTSVQLDATASGTLRNSPADVFAPLLPTNQPQPSSDEQVSAADLDALAGLGVNPRPLTPEEKRERQEGLVVYDEQVKSTQQREPREFKIAAERLPHGITNAVLQKYRSLYGTRKDQEERIVEKVKNELGRAELEYQKYLDALPAGRKADVAEFRRFLEAAKYAELRNHINHLYEIARLVPQLGLTNYQLEQSQSKMAGKLWLGSSEDVFDEENFRKVVFGPAPIPAARAQAAAATYTIPARLENGQVHLPSTAAPGGRNGR